MALGRVAIFGWSDSVHIRRWATGLADRGYQIRVISLGCSPIPGIETVIIPGHRGLSYLTGARRAVAAAREFQPDLVHAHYAGGYGLWGTRCTFAPLVVSVWGSDVTNPGGRLHQRFLVRRVLRRAVRITATGSALAEATRGLADDVTDRLSIIPFGVPVPDTAPTMPDPPVRLCFLKLHRPWYGPDILLRALAKARARIPDVRLTMAGIGQMTESLVQLAQELDLSGLVDFVGYIDNSRVYSVLEQHHIVVMPSLEESFGVAALEASACARPVIASRVGGIPEVVQDGITGVLVPPGDVDALAEAIVSLARDWKRCQAMGLEGYGFVRRTYSWDRSLDLMSDLYQQVIHETSTHSTV